MRPFWLVFLPAIAYQALALAAAVGHILRRRTSAPDWTPPVSILKPIRGLDPNTAAAFVSHAQQDYPEFEILFGVRDPNDPAVPEIRRLHLAYPNVSMRLIVTTTEAPNGKVGSLIDLAREARYSVWVVNDSDIRVTPSYLRSVVSPLADSSVGVVTCLYRAFAHSPATIWEAIGIATDFMPSTLVAQLIGVREFGLGSTLAFRAAYLKQAGGFEVLADYIADDYQLGKRISSLGKRAILSTYTVETSLGHGTWGGVWQHQLRWGRTIRRSKGAGYAGLPITHAGLWALVAVCTGAWLPALVLLSLRILSGFTSACFVLRSFVSAAFSWTAPLWDLYAFAVWLASYASDEVRWRDRVMTIDREGRIRPR